MGSNLTKKHDYTPHFGVPGQKEKTSMKTGKFLAKHSLDKQDKFMSMDICDGCGSRGAVWRAKLQMLLCKDCLSDVQSLIKEIEF